MKWIFILFVFFALHSNAQREDSLQNLNWYKLVKITSDKNYNKANVIRNINKALLCDSVWLDNFGLKGSIKDYTVDLLVAIRIRNSKYSIDLSPISGEGHDFVFIINSKTNKIIKESMCVGTIEAEPKE